MQAELMGIDNAVMGGESAYAGDSRLHVTFSRMPVHNALKSAEAGRPIFDEDDYITTRIPGDKFLVTVEKVTETHKRRFPKQWLAYQQGVEQATSGTPLEVWPQVTVSMVATLKASGVTTVEQLAEMSDANGQAFMGYHDLKRKAVAFLEAAKGEAVNNKMAAELSKRDEEIEALKAQMAALMEAQKPATVAKKA